VAAEINQHFVEVRAPRHLQPEEVLDLAGGDENGGTRGEADDDRVRNEIDQRAQPRQTHRQLNQAGQEVSVSTRPMNCGLPGSASGLIEANTTIEIAVVRP